MYIYDIWCETAEEVEIVKDVLSNVSRFMRSVIQIRFHEFNGRERYSKEKTAEILLPTVELSLAVKRVSDLEDEFKNLVKEAFITNILSHKEDKGGNMIPRYNDFSEDEKNEVAEIAKTLFSSSEKARREGILALEEGLEDFSEKISDMNSQFLVKLFRLMVDGNDASKISRIADNYTESSCNSDYERFCFLIIKVGVIYIQTGENPRVLAETLASYMGLSAEADFKERTQIFID